MDVRNAMLRGKQATGYRRKGAGVEGRQVNGEEMRKGAGFGSIGRSPQRLLQSSD